MSQIVLALPVATEQKVREIAAQAGQTLEVYLQQLVEQDVEVKNGSERELGADPSLSEEEFDRLLNELATGPKLPHLPVDFSRADIYTDRD